MHEELPTMVHLNLLFMSGISWGVYFKYIGCRGLLKSRPPEIRKATPIGDDPSAHDDGNNPEPSRDRKGVGRRAAYASLFGSGSSGLGSGGCAADRW